MGDWSKSKFVIAITKLTGDCTSFRSTSGTPTTKFHRNRPPFLMLSGETGEITTEEREFFELSNYSNNGGFIRKFLLPQLWNTQCLSSNGWLLTISENSTMKLVHPFRHDKINLPKLDLFQDHPDSQMFKLVKKLVIPSEKDFVAIAGLNWLGFWKNGDENWNTVTIDDTICDATYHNGLVYIFCRNCTIYSCDVKESQSLVQYVSKMPDYYIRNHEYIGMAYILGVDKKLLVIIRKGKYDEWKINGTGDFPGDDYGTTSFDVYEVDLRSDNWSKVDDLGKRALFLGSNSSFWIETWRFGCVKGNCIYFTDNVTNEMVAKCRGGGGDMGVYSLRDGSIEPHYRGRSLSRHSPPMWVENSY